MFPETVANMALKPEVGDILVVIREPTPPSESNAALTSFHLVVWLNVSFNE